MLLQARRWLHRNAHQACCCGPDATTSQLRTALWVAFRPGPSQQQQQWPSKGFASTVWPLALQSLSSGSSFAPLNIAATQDQAAASAHQPHAVA